jgi:hypothetical protein
LGDGVARPERKGKIAWNFWMGRLVNNIWAQSKSVTIIFAAVTIQSAVIPSHASFDGGGK